MAEILLLLLLLVLHIFWHLLTEAQKILFVLAPEEPFFQEKYNI